MSGRATIPTWMRPSLQSDLAQLGAGVRHVVRSELAENGASVAKLLAWARRMGLFAVVDRDGFFVLSRAPVRVRRTLRIDQHHGRHEFVLGQILGYPLCCCRAAAQQGEARIDEWAIALGKRRFVGLFRLTHPEGYRDGHSILSHIPCSPRCRLSLQMALSVLDGTPSRRPYGGCSGPYRFVRW